MALNGLNSFLNKINTRNKEEYIYDENAEHFNHPSIKRLNLTSEEKRRWNSFIIEMVEFESECSKLNDKCAAKDWKHDVLLRDKKGILYTTFKECNKAKMKKNYLIKQFHTNLSNTSLRKLVNEGNIHRPFEEKKIDEELLNCLDNFNLFKGIYLYGSNSIGKSKKIIGFCNDLINEQDKEICYCSMPRLQSLFKRNFQNSYLNDKIIDDCKRCDVLVLDDFGNESITTWFNNDILLDILIERAAGDAPIIIISDYSLYAIAKKYENIFNARENIDQKIKWKKYFDRLSKTSNAFAKSYKLGTKRLPN